MKNINVGVIGAEGHMGKAFDRRFKAVQDRGKLHGWALCKSTSHDNRGLAEASDLVALMVRPGQVEEALKGIRGAVRKGTGLLSLAGVVPAHFLQKHFDGAVGRGMADLGFEQAIHFGEDERIQFLMEALSEDECLAARDDEDVDKHTTLVACNPGISACHFLHNEAGARDWLGAHNELAGQTLGVSRSAMSRLQMKVFEEGDFGKKIEAVATKGGVTEAMKLALEAADGKLDCRSLYKVGMERIEVVRKNFVL